MAGVGEPSGVNNTAAPIVVAASGLWEGNDGPWSTFNISFGTSPQPARVLVSTTAPETWVIAANTLNKTQSGCTPIDPTECPQARGGLVNVNQSSSWQNIGIYDLGPERNLPDYSGRYVNGAYGLDVLGLGSPDLNGPKLQSQTFAAIASKRYYLGYLGLNPYSTNFSGFNDPHVSFISAARQNALIPSLSYGYTAGAQYHDNTTGSLTLGGYDASKFMSSTNASFSMAGDISRNLVVGLQRIVVNDGAKKSLLPNSILTFVDPTVPHIWLPSDSCKLFEDAFGIEYNDTVRRYLINDTLHSRLKTQNPSLSFLIGSDLTSEATVNITLPYSSFDLELGYPFVNETQRYFPLRRAENDTQYTLGRTFLQEAYLIVDYERSNFSIYQNAWTPNAPPQIIAIPQVMNATEEKTHKAAVLSSKTTPAIAVGITVFCILCVGLVLFFLRKRRAASVGKTSETEPSEPEMDGTPKPFSPSTTNPTTNPPPFESTQVSPTGPTERGYPNEKPARPKHPLEADVLELEGTKGEVAAAELRTSYMGVETGEGKEVAELAGDDLRYYWSRKQSRVGSTTASRASTGRHKGGQSSKPSPAIPQQTPGKSSPSPSPSTPRLPSKPSPRIPQTPSRSSLGTLQSPGMSTPATPRTPSKPLPPTP